MYSIETGRRWQMKTPKFSGILISFTWGQLDNIEKCSENENFPFSKFTFFTIFFFSQAWNLPKPLKILIFVLYFITYIQNRGNGNNYLNFTKN